MKYWAPDLLLATQLPPQYELEDKLGGLPWGMPAGLWPLCRSCGSPQSLLAQFTHHTERLDLGAEGRVLFVFQCNYDPGQCPTWEGGGGSNSCLILPAEELTSELTPPPRDDIELETEARVRGWLERDDGLAADLYRGFFDDENMWSLPEDVRGKVATGTKLGSVPVGFRVLVRAPETAGGS